jgi:glyoxylase-like metal-dependent hydrolase (beta-lactamase superfamily II)
VIDPGDDGQYIIQRIQDLGVNPVMIVATHGHFDHVCASLEVKMAFNIPFYLHQADELLLKRAQESARHWVGIKVDPPAPVDGYLTESKHPGGATKSKDTPRVSFDSLGVDGIKKEHISMIKFGNQQLQIIHTPGHTPGGVCLYSEFEKVLFTGDTLFANGGVGRTDFVYASEEDLFNSIKKIFQLDDQVKIYPGHGPESTLKQESPFHK